MYAVEPGQKVWIELSYGDSVGIVNGHRAYSGFYVARQHVALIHPLFPHSVSVNPAVVTLRPHDLSSTCAVRTPSQISFTWPKRIAMTTQSIWTFERYNQNGYGTMLVRTHFDGTVQALIAPTPDIDAHLHVALADIVKKIRFAPTTKCRAGFATFLVHFAVPSGTISAAQLHPWTPAATQERT